MKIKILFLLYLISLHFIPKSYAIEKMKFERARIQVGDKTINVEIADNPEKAAIGLMYRKILNSNEGMLFIFSDEQVRSFWMKNTFIDLSIGYFDKNKILINIQEMKAVNSEMVIDPPSYSSIKPAKYALEMNKNWFEKNKIKVGTKLKIEK